MRKGGTPYGIVDKAKRGQVIALPEIQEQKESKVRNQVEHPFGYIKSKPGCTRAVAKNLERNALRFDFNRILYNIFRADLLIRRAR